MLKLNNIKKDYTIHGVPPVHALKGININFRRNEFVAILGQSGCGKTTLLNIIGGLDRYTDGDLIIEGKSTKQYTDRDWNTYRNHSIGFIFQSYNLIGHINVLANVELALTISGISKKERKERALAALKIVGLEGKEKKKPNQLSGGQMQRVAIARALVNNPEILLADEPTGALDSETSIQVMDLLKEVAKDRLVIMVTHNPDLAYQYANRIVKMSDGLMIEDSNPYQGESEEERNAFFEKEKAFNISKGKKKNSSMSFFTALGLSFRNMMTKKGRTFLTAFAGSIGIIGIALILSVSYGMDVYINKVQTDALTSYPMTVARSTIDTSSLLSSIMNSSNSGTQFPGGNTIGSKDSISSMVNNIVSSSGQNDTKSFKNYLETSPNVEKYKSSLTSIQYRYNVAINTFKENDDGSLTQTYPSELKTDDSYLTEKTSQYAYETYFTSTEKSIYQALLTASQSTMSSMLGSSTIPTFSELIPSLDKNGSYSAVLNEQYDVLYGRMPEYKEDDPDSLYEMVLIVNTYNNIEEYLLFQLGLKSPTIMMEQVMLGMANTYKTSLINQGISEDILNSFVNKLNTRVSYEKNNASENPFSITFQEITDLTYYMPLVYEMYEPVTVGGKTSYFQVTSDTAKLKSHKIKITGIVRPKAGVTSTALSGCLGYLPQLGDYLLKQTNAFDDINDCFEYNETTKTYEYVEGSTHYPDGYNSVDANVLLNQEYHGKNPTKSAETLLVNGISSSSESVRFSGSLTSFEKSGDANYSFLGTWRGLLHDNVTGLDTSVAIKLNSDKTASISGDNIETIHGTWSNVKNTITLLSDDYTYGFVLSYSYTNAYISSLTGKVCDSDSGETLSGLLNKFGYNDPNTPSTIRLYPSSFAAKEQIKAMVNEYNSIREDEIYSDYYDEYVIEEEAQGHTDYYSKADWISKIGSKNAAIQNEIGQAKISVNDTVGTLMTSVQQIIDGVSNVLIAFVSISLIVSSIMIGIITYVSVLERTKEIGVLRAIGARKIDIANVFNAETIITGLAAGLLGVGIALLIDIPLGLIINAMAGLSLSIIVPWYGIVFLPLISVVLTVVSGLIPSSIASRQDPVVALRSE